MRPISIVLGDCNPSGEWRGQAEQGWAVRLTFYKASRAFDKRASQADNRVRSIPIRPSVALIANLIVPASKSVLEIRCQGDAVTFIFQEA